MPIDNFGDYWYRKQSKTPELLKEETKMTITVGSLKYELKKAFNAGKLAGLQGSTEPSDPTERLIDRMFRR